MAKQNPYSMLVNPRLRAVNGKRSITEGAVMTCEITGGQLFMSGDGSTHYYNSVRWYYFNEAEKGWLTGNQVYRQPEDSWKHQVKISLAGLMAGQWTILARILDMNNEEFFCRHDLWIEDAWTVLGSELAAAQNEGLPDLYTTMIMTVRYQRAIELVAAKKPPTAQQKPEHDALMTRLSTNAQKLADLHSEMAGCFTYKVNAVHIEKASQTKSRLRVTLAKMPGDTHQWKLIDWTNPLDRVRTGVYEASGDTDTEAIMALYAAWDSGNRYPDGKILRISPPQFFDKDKNYGEMDTDGSSFWDSVASFFEWIAMGAAVVAGVVTLVAPVPGSQVVSAAIWTSIFSSSAAAVINIAQRHEEGFSDWRADALDGLTIIGNIFGGAGMWARGATIITKNAAGQVVKYALIGQVVSDGVQGVLIAQQQIEEYDKIMANASLSPQERTDQLLGLFRNAVIAGTMTAISIKGTAEDIANLRKPSLSGETPASRLEKLKDPGAEVDMTGTPKAEGHTDAPSGHTTKVQENFETPRREDPTNVAPPKPKPRPKRLWSAPGPAPSRGMREMDDRLFAEKARQKGQYIVVRDGNADGVPFIGRTGDLDRQGKPIVYEGKPETMKAKTATEGPYKGLVCFDPTHARTADTLASLPGHKAMTVPELMEGKTAAQLMAADPKSEFRKRYEYFNEHKIEEMGYKVLPDDNYVVVNKDTGVRYHGDYDLHGVYNRDGSFVPDTTGVRGELNDEMGAKLIQHGAHDEWPDRQNPDKAGQNAGPQPPVTIYTPDGEIIGIAGGSLADRRKRMKQFYEERGLAWRYDEWEALPGNRIDTSE